ncbi:MAG: hypothetical protein E6Q67_12245 [Roseateles sp.]|nr:MAG: hypothetical protein E6Q67_12245 [Roseateles sp.]
MTAPSARLTPALPLLVLLCALGGCGAPSQPLPMALAEPDVLQMRAWVPDALRRQIVVAPVKGGLETSRWWGSKVSARALQQALEDSLYTVGLKPQSPEPPSRFELQAEVVQLDQPLVPVAGVSVAISVRYTLYERVTGQIIYQRLLSNVSDAGFTEALLSPSERLRIANERGLQTNIQMMLREVLALRPGPAERASS